MTLPPTWVLKTATHRHYKGGYYRFIGTGIHTETNEPLVAYEHVWPHEPGLYFRPRDMFFGTLEDGTSRFTLIALDEGQLRMVDAAEALLALPAVEEELDRLTTLLATERNRPQE